MRSKCLVVVKDKEHVLKESAVATELLGTAGIEIVTTTEMIISQSEYTLESGYAAILTLGGDGTVLKAISICSPKSPCEAQYIDKVGDDYYAMHSPVPCMSNRVLPVVFAFDHSTRGRLCNIKQPEFGRGYQLLREFLSKYPQGAPENDAVRGKQGAEKSPSWFQVINRRRFLVNASIPALNEIYIFCNEKGFLDIFEVCINAHVVYEAVRCDGIIVSTPTGSSGYNASASGPVVANGADVLILNIVCPADKKVLPVVVSGGSCITVRSLRNPEKTAAVIDGCLRMEAETFCIDPSGASSVSFAALGVCHDRKCPRAQSGQALHCIECSDLEMAVSSR